MARDQAPTPVHYRGKGRLRFRRTRRSFSIVRLFAGISFQRDSNQYPIHPDVRSLERLVLACHAKSELFRGHRAHRYANALLALSAHGDDWLRSPDDWKVRSYNRDWQFHGLVRHLLVRYTVPIFMNSAWLEGLTAQSLLHQRWFIHVAQGQNIRTAAGLPVALTKRQATIFLGPRTILTSWVPSAGPGRLSTSAGASAWCGQ